MSRSTVTIAIPTRNRRAYLAAAVDSALLAAGQGDQVVISDNASTDGTAAWLATITDRRVTVLHQPSDLGMVGNWNACLAAATGERFVLLSDDDMLERDAIVSLQALLHDPLVAFGYGRARVIDEQGAERTLGHLGPDSESGDAFLRAWFKFQRTVYPCATMLRTSELRDAGGYHADFGPFADVGAWLGVWTRNTRRNIAFVPRVIASYRSHEAALSTTNLEEGIGGMRALQAALCDDAGDGAEAGFEAMVAHYVASALRRRARAMPLPVVSYLALLLRHLPLVAHNWNREAYARQLRILATPSRYERGKRARAGASP